MAAAIELSEARYADGVLALCGLVARPTGASGLRPGVLLVPAVFGLTEHARDRARRVAELGYVVLVADLHGGGAAFASRSAT